MRVGACIGIGEIPAGGAGLDYIEPRVADLLMCDKDDAVFEASLAGVGAAAVRPEAVNCFLPSELKCAGPEVNPVALDAWAASACRRAEKVGVRIIVFGSGASRRLPDGFEPARAVEQMVDTLRRFGPIAADHGVTIALESLSAQDTNFITTIDEAAEIARAVEHPNIRLVADTYHMLRDGEGPESLARAGGLIVHVHCAEKAGRHPLGAGGEDQRPYFRALKDAGYDGRISLECKWRDIRAELPGGVEQVRLQWRTA